MLDLAGNCDGFAKQSFGVAQPARMAADDGEIGICECHVGICFTALPFSDRDRTVEERRRLP